MSNNWLMLNSYVDTVHVSCIAVGTDVDISCWL